MEPGLFSSEAFLPWREAVRRHRPEYLIEALLTGLLMMVIGVATALVDRSFAGVGGTRSDATTRRALVGLCAGVTLVLAVYSPWGRRSGAHMNPAITLAFLRLGKIGRWDSLFYIVAQCSGAIGGVLLARAFLGQMLEAPLATWMVAAPASTGEGVAFAAELTTAALAMLAILLASNVAPLQRWTGWLYALLVAAAMALESPLSGAVINPAWWLASAWPGDGWDAGWVYVLAPVLGMQLAVEAWRVITARKDVLCAKLAHNATGRCIFHCQHPDQARALALEVLHAELHRSPS